MEPLARSRWLTVEWSYWRHPDICLVRARAVRSQPVHQNPGSNKSRGRQIAGMVFQPRNAAASVTVWWADPYPFSTNPSYRGPSFHRLGRFISRLLDREMQLCSWLQFHSQLRLTQRKERRRLVLANALRIADCQKSSTDSLPTRTGGPVPSFLGLKNRSNSGCLQTAPQLAYLIVCSVVQGTVVCFKHLIL